MTKPTVLPQRTTSMRTKKPVAVPTPIVKQQSTVKTPVQRQKVGETLNTIEKEIAVLMTKRNKIDEEIKKRKRQIDKINVSVSSTHQNRMATLTEGLSGFNLFGFKN